GTVPAADDPEGRRRYARDLLGRFATRAFRRPVDPATADRLADLALAVAGDPGQTFEGGVAHAMAAVLTSPRFLFREEDAAPDGDRQRARFRELGRKPPGQLTDAEKAELKEARAGFQRRSRRFAELELSGDLRQAMRRETELTFEHVVRADRSLLELLDADYT